MAPPQERREEADRQDGERDRGQRQRQVAAEQVAARIASIRGGGHQPAHLHREQVVGRGLLNGPRPLTATLRR